MIVGNLYFIKNTNGLFYYGADYLKELTDQVREILVRPSLISAAESMFPKASIVVCENIYALWRHARQSERRGDVLYTPSSHPLPLIDRQWIVVHDAYPFLASTGKIKRLLLRLSLATSRCRVAYINESETFFFTQSLGVTSSRLIFAPNKVSETKHPTRPIYKPTAQLAVGLVGTDSAKKRYDELLKAITMAGLLPSISFRFYGHRTAYFEGIRQRHPKADIKLEESDLQPLRDFLTNIDVLVSVAELEGFGRPIAAALIEGVPCFLLKRPVFLEFFTTAHFFNDTNSLVAAIGEVLGAGLPAQPPYTPPPRVRNAYLNACENLRSDAL